MTQRSARSAARAAMQNDDQITATAYGALAEMGLTDYVADLDTFGYAVVPPELSGGAELVEPLIDAITRIATERGDGAPDFKTGLTHSDLMSPAGQHLFYLLVEDPIFQKALMNPVVLAFVRYLIPDPIISSVTSMIKGPGKIPLSLHSDQPIHPIPRSLVCNATYTLCDYDRDAGALCFTPGSHKSLRQPVASENFRTADGSTLQEVMAGGKADVEFLDAPNVVPVEAPAGSLVVWHGGTWHGAFNRTAPGLRTNLILYWCASSLRPQEAYREMIGDEVLAAGGDEFAEIIGKNVWNGWMSEGPQYVPGDAMKRARQRTGATV